MTYYIYTIEHKIDNGKNIEQLNFTIPIKFNSKLFHLLSKGEVLTVFKTKHDGDIPQ